MLYMHSEKPICAPSRLSDVYPNVAFEIVPMFVWPTMVLSRPFQAVRPTLPLSTPLSSRWSMCAWWLPVSLSAQSYPFTPVCPGQYTHRSLQRWMSTIDTFQSGLPISLFTFCSKLIVLWGWWHVWSDCQFLRQSSGGHEWLLPPPLSSWRLRLYRLHCLHGWWSHLACQWSPTQTGLWWLSHQCTLWGLAVCCFLEWAAWSLFCLLAILDSVFSSFLAGVSRWDTGIGLGTFPTPWFAWTLSAGVLAVMSPLLEPLKTLPVSACIPLCLSRLHGVGYGDFRRHCSMLWPVHLLSGLHWWEVLHEPRGLNRCVLGGSQYDSHCLAHRPALADLSVPLLRGLFHSQWHWAPHFDTAGRAGFVQDPLQRHSLQDWQNFLALQCCCCHMSIGRVSFEVDPKVSQLTCSFSHSSIKCDRWHRFACCSVVKSALQCLCLVWTDNITRLRYPIQLLLLRFGWGLLMPSASVIILLGSVCPCLLAPSKGTIKANATERCHWRFRHTECCLQHLTSKSVSHSLRFTRVPLESL